MLLPGYCKLDPFGPNMLRSTKGGVFQILPPIKIRVKSKGLFYIRISKYLHVHFLNIVQKKEGWFFQFASNTPEFFSGWWFSYFSLCSYQGFSYVATCCGFFERYHFWWGFEASQNLRLFFVFYHSLRNNRRKKHPHGVFWFSFGWNTSKTIMAYVTDVFKVTLLEPVRSNITFQWWNWDQFSVFKKYINYGRLQFMTK